MKSLKKVVFVLVALLALTSPAFAQSYLTGTTLSAAIDSTVTRFQLASATNVAVGGALYIDHEYMDITAVSGTTVTVTRAQRPAAHAASTPVIVATLAAKPIALRRNVNLAGLCTPTSHQWLPIVDIDTGNIYSCRFASSGATVRVWQINNATGYNTVGSVQTSWP